MSSSQTSLKFFYLGLIWCWVLLAVTLFMEYGLKLTPCPLCLVERFILILLGVVFLIAIWHKPKNCGHRVYGFILLLVAFLGIVVAGRHVWIQHHPNLQLESCGASLTYLLKTISLADTARLLFKGTSECSKVEWRFLGLSLADLSLLNFVMIALAALTKTIKSKI